MSEEEKQQVALVQAKEKFSLLAKETGYTLEQLVTVSKTVAKGSTLPELQMFMYVAKRSGLDPFLKQIYFQKRKNYKTGEDTVSIQVGIDGYRTIASKTGEYAGNDDPEFDDEEKPRKATVTVYRFVKGEKCAFSATARWSQYYPGEKLGFMWDKMPHLMLGKCAEALALRKAFPAELSGIYTHEEMHQAGGEAVDTTLPVSIEVEAKEATKEPLTKPQEVQEVFDVEPELEKTEEKPKPVQKADYMKMATEAQNQDEANQLISLMIANGEVERKIATVKGVLTSKGFAF